MEPSNGGNKTITYQSQGRVEIERSKSRAPEPGRSIGKRSRREGPVSCWSNPDVWHGRCARRECEIRRMDGGDLAIRGRPG